MARSTRSCSTTAGWTGWWGWWPGTSSSGSGLRSWGTPSRPAPRPASSPAGATPPSCRPGARWSPPSPSAVRPAPSPAGTTPAHRACSADRGLSSLARCHRCGGSLALVSFLLSFVLAPAVRVRALSVGVSPLAVRVCGLVSPPPPAACVWGLRSVPRPVSPNRGTDVSLYGEATVSSWRFEAWNEPDHGQSPPATDFDLHLICRLATTA